MKPFTYARPATVAEALTAIGNEREAKFLGGGTNLIDLMKMGVEQPAHLVDITRLPLAGVEEHAGGLRIGALARNSDVAVNPLVRERYPLLSEALLSGASPQLRNMATVGGNLLQRTRCYYFYDPTYKECNKRVPGSGCAAIAGYNRLHAILGASEQCIATHPSDMAVAMMALDAQIVVQSSKGERTIPIDSFYRLPGNTPQIENELKPGELIVAVDLPQRFIGQRSNYVKARDRNSFAFALSSAAVVLNLNETNQIQEARIALGGVAHMPWRVPAAEALLKGRDANEASFQAAADALVQGARPYKYNAFKVELARRCAVRAMMTATNQA